MKICILSTFPAYSKVRVNQALKGGGGCVRERRRERKLQEPRLSHFAAYFNYPSCHFNDQPELGVRFSAWLTSRGNVSPREAIAAEHEKLFATECRRRDSHKKPNVNVKKIAVLDFVKLTFLQGEDQPHLKFILAVGKSWKCGVEFSSLMRVYWVAINQKRKLVRTGLQTLCSQN